MTDPRRTGQIATPDTREPEAPEVKPDSPYTGLTSQATAVEQARAVAHVQAAYTVADARPRSTRRAREEMLETCGLLPMAQRAFYRFPRAGQQLTGMTIHLAVELARIWGNVQWGKAELRRDARAHESEMLAYAIDLQTNARVETTFIVPHLRDGKRGETPSLITDVRDIYELLANMGARREREMIKNILPKWFTDEAEAACRHTLETGGDGAAPLAQRISAMLDAYGKMGVSPARLAKELGKPESAWEGRDVANLGITYRSLVDGTLTVEEAFPTAVITSETIAAQARAADTGEENDRHDR